MKGIPRRIINNRLIILENEVNTILSKFIQKTVYITKDIDDITPFSLKSWTGESKAFFPESLKALHTKAKKM